MSNITDMRQSNPITTSKNVGDYKVIILPNSGVAVVVELYNNGEYGLACACCTLSIHLKDLQDVARELEARFVLWAWTQGDYPECSRHLFPTNSPAFVPYIALKGEAPIKGSLMDMVKWEGTSRGELRSLIELDAQSPETIWQLQR